MDWFATKGEVVELVVETLALVLAAKAAFPAMSNSNYLTPGAIVFYLLLLLVPLSFWLIVRGKKDISSGDELKLSSLPGYDRSIPARSRQDEVEEGYEQAKQIWAASIAGVYFSHLRGEDRKKITRVLLVDPNSALMETLIRIQPLRGEDMPVNVKRAVEICKDEKIEVRLSSHPLLNVVLFDPGTPYAWARVQEFIPYFQGEESVVYAIRKEEWKDLYETIENSFKQTWENGRDPNR